MRVLTHGENQLFNLIWDALLINGRPVRGQTQKEEARDSGIKDGMLEGMCKGIAAFINVRRLETYPLMEHIPALEEWTVRKSITSGDLFELKNEYDNNLAETTISSDAARDQFWTNVNDVILEWVRVDVQFAAAHEARRRELILQGDMEPTVDDENWIAERLDEIDEVKSDLTSLLKKAQSKG